MTDSQQPDEFGRIPSRPEAPRGPQPPLPPHPTGRAPERSDGQTANDAPDQVDIVEQIKDSELSDSGPNETLRRHIELFSKYGPVFKSLGHTILGAAIVPFAVAFLVFQLRPDYEVTKLSGAILNSVWELWLPLFVALCLARSLRLGGLAEKHFRWSPVLCDGLLKTLELIVWCWLPLRFVYTSLITFDGGKWNNSLGRLLFVAAMIVMTLGLYRTSRAIRQWNHDRESQRPHLIQGIISWFLPAMSACLVLMSFFGYHFTAVQMSQRVLWTILLMIGIALIAGLVSQLLLIAQFGIKLRELSRDDEGVIRSDESIDISGISTQVNRLLRATALVAMLVVGWQIWANVLPIFGYLNDWHVYPTETAAGVGRWVSVGHLLMAAGIVFITFVLSRNLPGLLEITLLDRLPLDRGGRYAISFIVKYLLCIVGLVAACNIIGFSWSKVQWLAAGLTVGLGFGLQEIFANVISGIIILIERPIRVGDVVTVDGTTGTVTRMQLRATTIMDRDYRELIVPNKKFITENVMNWTLTTLTSRISFKVGVAYGSDTQLVNNTLLAVARRHPLINESPEPEVVFESFGDSTLNFELRVFIPNREVYSKVLHELNMAIEAAFEKKEIEIAFPQQDIYIKNLNELPVRDPSNGQPLGGGSFAAEPGRQTASDESGSVSAIQAADPNLTTNSKSMSQSGQGRAVQKPVNQAGSMNQTAPETNETTDGFTPPLAAKEYSKQRPRVLPFRLKDVRPSKDSVRSDRLRDAG